MEQRGTDSADQSQMLAMLLGEMLGFSGTNVTSAPPADDEHDNPAGLSDEPEQEWLSVKAASEYIHVSRTTLYRLVKEGKLPSHRIRKRILIHKETLDACIKDGLLA